MRASLITAAAACLITAGLLITRAVSIAPGEPGVFELASAEGANPNSSEGAALLMDAPKTKWPELVGMTGEEAEAVIRRERPDLKVQVMPPGTVGTMDWREDRVRIWVGEDGKVGMPPSVG